MSTQYRTQETDELLGTSWYGGPERGRCFDWGFDYSRPLGFFESRPSLQGEDGTTYAWEEFETQLLDQSTWTFGEFGGTFELGSGDLSTWLGL